MNDVHFEIWIFRSLLSTDVMPFAKLDRDLIVEEALLLLSEEGLGQVSLRKIAKRLNVSVSALYWHVRDKDALYSLLTQKIYAACVDNVPDSDHWTVWLRDLGLSFWHAQSTIRDARQLLMIATVPDEMREEYSHRIAKDLEDRGFSSKDAELAHLSIQALVSGWTALKLNDAEKMTLERLRFERALNRLIAGWNS